LNLASASILQGIGKVNERHGSIRMTRRTECKCSSKEINGLIQVRQDAMLLESVLQASGKVVERHGAKKMARRTECKCSTM